MTTIGAFRPGELILYAAPHPAEPFGATTKKAALVTVMRFFNTDPATQIAMNLYFVRYNSSKPLIRNRLKLNILPVAMRVNPGELKVETTPLVLEEGDALIAYAFVKNKIEYVISGVERDV